MRIRLRTTRRTFVLTAVIGSFLIVTMVATNTLRASSQTISATDEAVSEVSSFYLEAMADRGARTITNQINYTFNQMEKALVVIENEGIASEDELRVSIGKIKRLLSLEGFALADGDNIVYTEYTTYTGGSRHEFLSEERMADRVISTVYLYGSSRQLCLAIPTPGLTIMEKPIKACFVQIDIKEIVDLLAFDDQGGTYFGLYAGNGSNLSGTELGPLIAGHNLFAATKDIVSDAAWQKSQDDFERGLQGSMSLALGNIEETLFYVPIPDTGWEMTVLIHESVIHDRIRQISERNLTASRNQIMFTLVAMLVLATILLFELRTLSEGKLEAEKQTSKTFRAMAHTDAMTGVGSKHAYSESEAALNQRMQEDEVEGLTVVVCDINGLKYVNDTQGHAAGDQLIKDASALICYYFDPETVFRIGGDEFVVLVEGMGQETLEETIGNLNRQVEANIAEDGVVIAVGHATFAEGDQSLADMFERADQMMYERKKELKSMGAKTRDGR